MKQKISIFLLFLLLPMLVLGGTRGKIKGKVMDQDTGEPLIGANIIVIGTSLGAATDIEGNYTILNVEPGVYEVRASYVGYQAKTVSNVRINADLTTDLDFELLGSGFETEEVSVVAVRPLVNKSNTNANRITTSEDIDALPVRGMNNIISLTPGVTYQDKTVFVRGGRQDEVGFYLEGASISDPMVGGRQVHIIQDAVEEIQVQSGGYTAEYGGANAGIIYTQFKSGTPDWQASVEFITDNFMFKGEDDLIGQDKFLDTYSYGYRELIGTVSGPIFTKKVKFFGLFNYDYMQDRNPQPWPGMDLGYITDATTGDSVNFNYPAGPLMKNSEEIMNFTGTVTFDFNPIIVRLVGTYTSRQNYNPWTTRFSGNISTMLNTDRIQERQYNDGAFSAKLTHILGPTTYYELSGGYSFSSGEGYDPYLEDNFMAYGDSVANANAGIYWTRSAEDIENGRIGRYRRPTELSIMGFQFHAPGDLMSSYFKYNRDKINVQGALSTQLGDAHSIKIGGEFQMFTIRNYSWSNEGLMTLPGIIAQNDVLAEDDPLKLTTEEIIINRGVNNYGYDIYGNSVDDNEIYGPKNPKFISAYIQDKIEWKDLIVNVGFRWDYIDIDNEEFVDPTRPELAINKNSGAIDLSGFKDVGPYNGVSPRLGVSFAVTDRTVFHAQYGQFVQQTRLRDVYQGLYNKANNLRGGFEITAPVGYNVRPTRTTQYELGFTQQIGEFASFDITGFYKDIQNQVVFDKIYTAADSPFGAYNILTNGDFATTKGVEISFNMRRIERVQVNASISLQDAQGTGSYPNSMRGVVGAPLDGVTIFKPQYVAPLEFNRPFSGTMNVDYRFGVDDGGPILSQLGVSALMTFSAGHPYTLGKGGADLEGDARDRQPLEPLNSSSTPGIFQVDVRIDKTFRIADMIDANIYLYVINLFDAENIQNVFLRTGSVNDDGYLSDPTLGGQLVKTYGPEYEALYRAINIDYYEQWQVATTGAPYTTNPFFYGPPRQIRLGVKLSY